MSKNLTKRLEQKIHCEDEKPTSDFFCNISMTERVSLQISIHVFGSKSIMKLFMRWKNNLKNQTRSLILQTEDMDGNLQLSGK